MLGRLRPDSLLLKHTEKVFRLEESHREVLRLSLNILLKFDLFEEILCGLSSLKEVDHEHNHDFDGLLIQFRQIQLFLLLLFLRLTGGTGCFLRLVLRR